MQAGDVPMRELNDREMEQAQGGFGSLHSGYREFGISRGFLNR